MVEQTRVCSNCDELQPLNQFSIMTNGIDVRDKRCKTCVQDIKKNPNRTLKPHELDVKSTDFNDFNWQGGKYVGTIFKPDEKSLTIRVGESKNRFQKNMAFDKFNSEEEAYKEAKRIKEEASDTSKLTKNKYKLISGPDDNIYMLVQLSQNYCMLTDVDHLDLIKSYFLSISTTSHDRNYKSYCMTWNNVTHVHKFFHTLITGYDMVDHINRYPLDNRSCNLRSTDPSTNNKNKTFVVKTEVITDHRNNDYTGVVVYYHNKNYANKQVLSEVFKTKEEAKQWTFDTKESIDREYMAEAYYSEKLRKEFEDIMKEHSDGFKWNDVNVTENKEKDDQLEAEKEEASPAKQLTDKKTGVYNKFKDIDSNFDPEKEGLITKGNTINHIKHTTGEYKYCSGCEVWYLISNFPKQPNNYDGLDRRCKVCKNAALQERRRKSRIDGVDEKDLFKCDKCDRVYTSLRGLSRHVNKEHEDKNLGKEFKCDKCDKMYNTQKWLTKHENTVHSNLEI